MNLRDHIATTCSIEPNDFRGLRSLGEAGGYAHQPALRSFSEVGLFGESLPSLLDELKTTLAA